MKKEYVTPTMVGERFSADEYVAACITGTIQCVYPGTEWAKGDNATISFNGTTASGYEFVNGKAVTGRPISHITGYEEAVGTYDVTWTSVDNVNHTGTYQHKGRLIVSSIDTNRPNHS